MGREIHHVWLAFMIVAAGCSGTNGPGFLGDHDGSVEIALGAVPDDVGCIRILASADIGSLTTDFNVTLGEEFSTVMEGLPYGSIQFSGEAFEESCADVDGTSVPSWVAPAVTATVEPGVVNVVRLVMRRNGRVCVEVSFEDDFASPGTEANACGLDPDPGPCKAAIPRWYFDSAAGDCRRFVYGGCAGNDNNFTTLAACRETCAVEEGGCVSSVCDLPPAVVGPCDARVARWTFDAERGGCVRFFYGGCGGNGNNFTSLAACEESCSVASTTCGDRTCDPDQECQVFEPTGEEFCADSCELTRCAADEVCELREVQCIREPCPPIAVCVAVSQP